MLSFDESKTLIQDDVFTRGEKIEEILKKEYNNWTLYAVSCGKLFLTI